LDSVLEPIAEEEEPIVAKGCFVDARDNFRGGGGWVAFHDLASPMWDIYNAARDNLSIVKFVIKYIFI
jgi:hypothetical protein